jgi:hypothetical protein
LLQPLGHKGWNPAVFVHEEREQQLTCYGPSTSHNDDVVQHANCKRNRSAHRQNRDGEGDYDDGRLSDRPR